MVKLVVVFALAAGCGGATLGEGENKSTPDARTSGGNPDASQTVGPDAATTSACPSGRKLYLNFDGVTLTKGTPSDATMNKVSWMGNTTVTLPPYKNGAADRAVQIQTVTDAIKATLAASQSPIEVVTTRPAAGPYVMVVFGGTNTTNTASTTQVATQYAAATNFHDCGDTIKNDVAWVSDGPLAANASDWAIGAIGWGLGLNGTTDVNDCMCGWASMCTPAAGACTLSSSITTGTLNTPETACPNINPQDEVAAFSTLFCSGGTL